MATSPPPARFAVCPGSLVPSHWHDASLLDLLGSRLNNSMINFVACKVVEAVRCRPSDDYLTPPESPGSEAKEPVAGLLPLGAFIKSVIKKSRCHVPTLLASAVYLERLRTRLPSTAQGCPTTRHRCALAAIVIAAKYLNDSSPMNKHWARYSEFSLAEINLMEMQLLAIFNFELRFDEAELISVLKPLLPSDLPDRPAVRNSMPVSMSMASLRDIVTRDDVRMEDGRRDEVVSRGRIFSVDAAALAAIETGEAGKQLTPAYQRTPGARPRGPLPEPPSTISPPPPPVPRRPSSVNRRISYPRHRRPGSTTPLSSPPLEDLLSPYQSSRLSSHSSYSSSSTLSSASSGPRTPHTPLTSHLASSPVPPVPHTTSTTSGHAYSESTSNPNLRKRTHIRLPSFSRNPSPSLSFALAHEPELWPLVSTSQMFTLPKPPLPQQTLRKKGGSGHVRERYVQGELKVDMAKAGHPNERVIFVEAR